MLLTWILLATLVVAIIPTGESGIQSLAKALLRHDQLPNKVQGKVSYDIQCIGTVVYICHYDYTLFTRLIAFYAKLARIRTNFAAIALLE